MGWKLVTVFWGDNSKIQISTLLSLGPSEDLTDLPGLHTSNPKDRNPINKMMPEHLRIYRQK